MLSSSRNALPLDNSPLLLSSGIWWLFATVGALYPMLPFYCTSIGLDSSDLAILFAVMAVASLVSGQLIGYLADTRFSRKQLLLIGTLLSALVEALFPLVPATLPWMAVWSAVLSIFYSQRVSIYNAMIFDSRGGEEIFPRIRLVGSAGFAVVTVLVGWLADHDSLGPAIMWPALVVVELFYAIVLVQTKDHPSSVRREARAAAPSFKQVQGILLGNPLIRRFLLFVFLFQIAAQPLHFLQIRLLEELGSSAVFSTATLATAAISEMLVFYFGARILARYRLMALLALVPLALGLRFGLVFAFPHPMVILACSSLHMVGFGLAYLCCVVFMNREVAPELKSSGQTLFALVFSALTGLLGNLASAATLALFESRLGFSPAVSLRLLFGIGAGLAFASLLAWVPMDRLSRRRLAPGT